MKNQFAIEAQSNSYNYSQPHHPPGYQMQPSMIMKPQKNISQVIRAGDWICFKCNNLNFSFRKECNRCQNQTKKENFMQNYMIFQNQENSLNQIKNYQQIQSQQANYGPRKPFQDITNMEGRQKIKNQNFQQSRGFISKILLTPPKSVQQVVKTPQHFQAVPYYSPKDLPSLSPIVRNLEKLQIKDQNQQQDVNKYITFQQENVEIENTVIKDLNINEYKCNYDKIIEEDENKEKINWVCMHCFNLNFSQIQECSRCEASCDKHEQQQQQNNNK